MFVCVFDTAMTSFNDTLQQLKSHHIPLQVQQLSDQRIIIVKQGCWLLYRIICTEQKNESNIYLHVIPLLQKGVS